MKSPSAPLNTGSNLPAFEESDYYERLLTLRDEEPNTFLLRTSPATRAALGYYEKAKAQARADRADQLKIF